jgi:hypothetical protein
MTTELFVDDQVAVTDRTEGTNRKISAAWSGSHGRLLPISIFLDNNVSAEKAGLGLPAACSSVRVGRDASHRRSNGRTRRLDRTQLDGPANREVP